MMSHLFSQKTPSIALFGLIFVTVSTENLKFAVAFSPEPTFNQFNVITTTINTNGDIADVYWPSAGTGNPMPDNLPVVLLLQGANVNRSNYSNFASHVARYGFAVVVPNHLRTVTIPGVPVPVTGLLAEQQQINDVLAFMKQEDTRIDSPLFNLLDSSKLGLLGHSQGGAVGLSAIGNLCLPFLCEDSFQRPDELIAGAFFGANLRDPLTNQFIPIDNANIPIALLQGYLDGIALPERARMTYDNILNPPKALITVQGSNHYGITNLNNPSNPTSLMIPPPRPDQIPTLDQEIALETVARWSSLFLRAHLQNDRDAFNYVYGTGDLQDENVTVISQTRTVPELTSPLGILAFGFFAVKMRKSSQYKPLK